MHQMGIITDFMVWERIKGKPSWVLQRWYQAVVMQLGASSALRSADRDGC